MGRKGLLVPLAFCTLATPAVAGTHEWTSGWAMGTTEYAVDDGNRNSLLISCPDHQDGSSTGGYYLSKVEQNADIKITNSMGKEGKFLKHMELEEVPA